MLGIKFAEAQQKTSSIGLQIPEAINPGDQTGP